MNRPRPKVPRRKTMIVEDDLDAAIAAGEAELRRQLRRQRADREAVAFLRILRA